MTEGRLASLFRGQRAYQVRSVYAPTARFFSF
jgi:hypothetical protein